MGKPKNIGEVLTAVDTIEGAGVRLKRAFGYHQVPKLDPFLLLDYFKSEDTHDFEKGFPWHPHRGIETITYILDGKVEHQDSMGNKGVIGSGEIQWMTAGSGIIHQEMPVASDGSIIEGFQLWANLPAKEKMTVPKYRSLTPKDIPEVTMKNGVTVKVISGDFYGTKGPVSDIAIAPEYYDVFIPPGFSLEYELKPKHSAFAFVFRGSGIFEEGGEETGVEKTVIFSDGEYINVQSGKDGVRFLLVSGIPLKEPIEWYGPIVMNTKEEIKTAMREYEEGTFIKENSKKG